MMKPTLITIVAALTILGCGAVARVAEPAAVYSELTVEEYSEAEAHFSGTEGVMSSPFVSIYWTDERCQELLDKKDNVSYVLVGLGVLTGGSGLTSVIPTDMEEKKKESYQIAFGSLTLALGVADAVLVGVVKTLSTRYEQNCRTERPAPAMKPMQPVEVEAEVDGGVQ
jgi:hypothetical protein